MRPFFSVSSLSKKRTFVRFVKISDGRDVCGRDGSHGDRNDHNDSSHDDRSEECGDMDDYKTGPLVGQEIPWAYH